MRVALIAFSFSLLSSQDEPERAKKLVQQLGAEALEERSGAQAELVRMGASALESLRKAAEGSADLDVRGRAREVIRRIESRLLRRRYEEEYGFEYDAPLEEAIKVSLGEFRAQVQTRGDDPPLISGIASSYGVTLGPSLLELLREDPAPAVRKASAYELGESRNRLAAEDLGRALLRDGDADVRRAAAAALGKVGGSGAAPALCRALVPDAEDEDLQSEILLGLSSLGDATSAPFLRLYLDKKLPDRRRALALRALSQCGDREDLPRLPEFLQKVRVPGDERNPVANWVQRAARTRYRFTEDPPRIEIASPGFSPDERRQVTACLLEGLRRGEEPVTEVLGALGGDDVYVSLRAITKDLPDSVKGAAIQTLARLGGASVVDDLETLLKEEKTPHLLNRIVEEIVRRSPARGEEAMLRVAERTWDYAAKSYVLPPLPRSPATHDRVIAMLKKGFATAEGPERRWTLVKLCAERRYRELASEILRVHQEKHPGELPDHSFQAVCDLAPALVKDLLLKTLVAGGRNERERAARSLALLDAGDAREALRKTAVSDPDAGVRHACVWGMQGWKDESLVGFVLERIDQDDSPRVRYAAMQVLGEYPSKADPSRLVAAARREKDQHVRETILSRIESLDDLADLALEGPEEIRPNALRAIANLLDRRERHGFFTVEGTADGHLPVAEDLARRRAALRQKLLGSRVPEVLKLLPGKPAEDVALDLWRSGSVESREVALEILFGRSSPEIDGALEADEAAMDPKRALLRRGPSALPAISAASRRLHGLDLRLNSFAWSLGSAGNEEALREALWLLKRRHVEEHVLVNAAISLESLGDPEAVGPLGRLIPVGGFKKIPEFMAGALGAIGDAGAVPALGRALREERDADCRLFLVNALEEIGDPSCVGPLLEAAVEDREVQVRAAALLALGSLGWPAVTGVLEEAANIDPDRLVRAAARVALAGFGRPLDHAEWRRLYDFPWVHAERLWKEAGRLAPSEVRLPIIRDLKERVLAEEKSHPGSYHGRAELDAIGALGTEEAALALLDLAGCRGIALNVVEALRHCPSPRATSFLIRTLHESDGEYPRRLAVYSLADPAHRAAVPELVWTVRDERDPWVRLAALRALRAIGDEKAAEPLRALYRAERWAAVRREMAITLASLGDSAGLEDLRALEKSGVLSNDRLLAVALVVRLEKDAGSEAWLLERLSDPRGAGLRVRAARAAAYARGSRRVFFALLSLLKDKAAPVRRAASNALAEMTASLPGPNADPVEHWRRWWDKNVEK